MDPVDQILDGLKYQSAVFARLELSGDWGFEKDAMPGAPFHVVLEGEAWIELPDHPPLRLGAGDVGIPCPRARPTA